MCWGRANPPLTRVETDTNRDGKIDKWEFYDPAPGGRLVLRSVESEPDASGKPTFRLRYRPDGSFEGSEILTNKAPQH